MKDQYPPLNMIERCDKIFHSKEHRKTSCYSISTKILTIPTFIGILTVTIIIHIGILTVTVIKGLLTVTVIHTETLTIIVIHMGQ